MICGFKIAAELILVEVNDKKEYPLAAATVILSQIPSWHTMSYVCDWKLLKILWLYHYNVVTSSGQLTHHIYPQVIASPYKLPKVFKCR